jgi:hypothetical protein
MHLPPGVLARKFRRSARSIRRTSSTAPLLACIAFLCAACGSSAPSPPVAITIQPLSQSIPIGETATFTVTATGTAPLSYQWTNDGVDIAGSNRSSYTTPAVALGSGGSTEIGSFQVTVSDRSSAAVSNPATLTAGPRSPQPGDLRYLIFEQVDLPGLSPTEVIRGSALELSFPNAVGAPLPMGLCSLVDGCAWGAVAYNLPSPMTGLSMF